mgnify:FL=1
MKKLKIDTLDKLETFISDDSISKEARLEVFEHALKEYVFFIVLVKDEDQKEVFDPDKKIVAEMKRIINEIKTSPQKQNYKGFMVLYN